MGLLHAGGHRLGVACKQGAEQLLGGSYAACDLRPTLVLRGVGVLARHLAVGHERLARALVVGEIPQVDEEREHVVGAVERRHVVGVGLRVHLDAAAAHKLHHLVVQAVEVHVDVLAQGLERLGLGPVAGELARHHGAHHRTGRIHLARAGQAVAVVPGLALVQVAAPLLAQRGDLVGGEAHERRHLERVDHAELVEHVER